MSSTKDITCQVTNGFRSPKKNGATVIYKQFNIGDRVKGKLLPDDGSIRMFRTVDGFLLPKSHLNPIMQKQGVSANGIEDVEYAEIVDDKKPKFNVPLKGKVEMPDILKNRSKTAVHGAIVGLVIGLGYAMAKSKNKIIFSVIGSVGGFVLGNMYNNYINEDQK